MSESNQNAVVQRNPFFSDLDPWNHWEPLRGLTNRLFADWPQDWQKATGVTPPKVDITESDEQYHVRAEIPGVSKEDLTVEFERGVLSIRGEKKSRQDDKTEKGRHLECTYGAFSRTFSLPQDADADQISAEFKDGVLDIVIQKSPDSKPKQIAVQG